jgi:uncharacterized protein (TIRG00374 family)
MPVFFMKILPWCLSIGSIIFIFNYFPFVESVSGLSSISLPVFTLAMVVTGINFFLRGFRWLLFLNSGTALILSAYAAIGLGLNAVLPGKVGEVTRLALAAKLPGSNVGRAMGSILIERFFDLVVLIALVSLAFYFIGFSDTKLSQELINAADYLLVLCLILFVVVTLINNNRMIFFTQQLIGRLFNEASVVTIYLNRFVSGLSEVSKKISCRTGLVGFFMTCAIWLVVAVSVKLVAMATPNLSCSFSAALAIASVTTLASALPSAPGAWGVYEAAGVLIAVKVTEFDNLSTVGTFILCSHLAQYIPVIVTGIVGWIMAKNTSVNTRIY